MSMFQCPACGRVLPAFRKYDSASDWCEDCVEFELLDQQVEADAPVERQVFG